MPALSPTMSEGKLSKWLVKEGDKIKAGDLLAEIETDKAIMEFESSEDGTLKKILVNEGVENIKVNEPIALLETSNSLVDENSLQKIVNENKKISKKEPENNNSLLLGTGDILQKNPGHKEKEVLNKDRIKISPLAKKIAIQHNINFRDLEGTGPSGRIIKADIEKHIKIGNAPTPLKDHKPLVNDENDYTLLNPMRKTIAERLSKSKREIPHFYLRKKVYVDKLLSARKSLNKKLEIKNIKISINDLIIKAIENYLGMMEVFEDSKTGIFTLSINASEPTLASDLNMAIIQELDTHQRNYNKDKTTDTKTFIEERIVTTERDLMSAEENLKVFRDRNRRIENSPSLQLEEQRLRREVAVLTGVFTTLKQQLETTKIQEFKDSDYVIIVDPPEVSLYPSKPKKRRSVILAGLIGITFGVLLALFKESLSNKNKEEKIKMSKAKFLFVQNISDLIPKRFK